MVLAATEGANKDKLSRTSQLIDLTKDYKIFPLRPRTHCF
ncbi:MAG: hypothetical protein OJF50_003801 [Nitrospira sp.]|nr:hypothetical protein [Nitrospira sp.]